MRSTALFCLLLASGTSSAADWKEFSGDGVATVYIDESSIRGTKSLVKVWTLWNLSEPDGPPESPYLSRKSLYHLNCIDGTFSNAITVFYPEIDGRGNALHTYQAELKDLVFREATPDSIGAALLREGCKRRVGKGA